MRKNNKKTELRLTRETVRVLAGAELRAAAGGYPEDRTSGPIDLCPPPSVGVPSCTGCPSVNASCPSRIDSCDTHCTIFTTF